MLFDLYKSLHSDDSVTTKDDLKVYNLENAIVHKRYNDLGFSAGNRFIILMEHQSTLCKNMPLRMLFYIADEYHKWLSEHNLLHMLYHSSEIALPSPEFYVISTVDGYDETLSLSKCFSNKSSDFLDLKIKVIDKGHCKIRPLNQYLSFIEEIGKIKDQVKAGVCKMSMREIYLKALENLSPDSEFVKYMRREIDTMVKLTEMQFDEEEFLKGIREDAREEGIEKGIEKGIEEGIEKVARRMLSAGRSIDTIAEDTGLTKERVFEIARERSK